MMIAMSDKLVLAGIVAIALIPACFVCAMWILSGARSADSTEEQAPSNIPRDAFNNPPPRASSARENISARVSSLDAVTLSFKARAKSSFLEILARAP